MGQHSSHRGALTVTSSEPPFSDTSFWSFGVVLCLLLFQAAPLLITGKGATSSNLLFHHQQGKMCSGALEPAP